MIIRNVGIAIADTAQVREGWTQLLFVSSIELELSSLKL